MSAERSSGGRWALVYALSLLITPMMLMPFIPGTPAFLYALIACLVGNAVVGALVARALIRRRRELATWESKLLIVALLTTTACVLGLGAILLGA